MTRKLALTALVLIAALLLASMLACGTAGMTCYSTYAGCEETVVVIMTAIAR